MHRWSELLIKICIAVHRWSELLSELLIKICIAMHLSLAAGDTSVIRHPTYALPHQREDGPINVVR